MICSEIASCIKSAFFPCLLVIVVIGSIAGLVFGNRLGLSPETLGDLKAYVKEAFGVALALKSVEGGNDE
jgi:hypothetical protein